MKTAIPEDKIIDQLIHQLSSNFSLEDAEIQSIRSNWGGIKSRLEHCFSLTPNKYYSRDGETFFNPFHSAQYTIFLYFYSNTIYKETRNSILADKIYYLNKIMNGCDMFYEVELPQFFTLDHPVGSVMGRASYGEGFSFGQCCTVGNNRGIYPVIGKNVTLCAGASILGNCHIGDNVTIGAYSGVKDQDIPDNSLVFGQSPNLIIKPKK